MNKQPMNVLFVISDQHNATCCGHEGHPQAITPRLDALAAEGTRFSAAYCQNPICTPSRVSLLSGQYCHNTGFYGLNGPTPTRLPSFMGHFRAHGYRTALIGKLHLPHDPEWWPANETDEYSELLYPERPENAYYQHLRARGLDGVADHERLPEFPGGQQHEGRPSALAFEDSAEGWSVQRAMAFMDQCGAQPFCMEVSFFRPHQCYTPSQPFWDLYPADLALPETFEQDPSGRPPHFRAKWEEFRRMKGLIEPKDYVSVARRVWRGYLGNISQCDHALGMLLDYLERTGKAQNTIVVYGADHGAYSGMHGIPEKAPGICSEAVCRVPFIWRVPGVTQAGHTSRQLVENVDLAPTICSLCGLPPMETTDGHDISGLLRGRDEPVREAAVTEHVWSRSIRWDRWRLVHYQRQMFDGADVGELYDIVNDPDERRNLYADAGHRAVVEEGRRLLLEWLIGTTRHVTAWTPPRWPDVTEMTAADGKESNLAGVPARLKQGQLNYL